MTSFWIRLPAVALLMVLAGCGTSPPPRYHGLDVPAPSPVSGGARMLVEILPVAIPERLNREEMVLTGETGQLDVRDGDHWAAPLSDEIRQILADSLWRRLLAADVYLAPVVPAANGLPQYRLALRVERFEAVPGRSAVVEGSWTVRRLPQGQAVSCRAGMTLALQDRTPDAAAKALSDGVGQLTRLVAESVGRLEQGMTSACPDES
jgi:hypothetical protein